MKIKFLEQIKENLKQQEKQHLLDFFNNPLSDEYIKKYNDKIIKKYKGIIPGNKLEEDIKFDILAKKQDLFTDHEVYMLYNQITTKKTNKNK